MSPKKRLYQKDEVLLKVCMEDSCPFVRIATSGEIEGEKGTHTAGRVVGSERDMVTEHQTKVIKYKISPNRQFD